MQTIKQTYSVNAPARQVWQALINPKIINKWGGGPAKMDDRVGTKFSLWGGEIHGKNIEVVPEKKLRQEWYAGDWPEPSVVTFTLTEKSGQTTVQLLHENVPDSETKSITDGWHTEYLGPQKEYVEKIHK